MQGGFGTGGTNSLLHALQQQRRLHAACMALEIMERDDRELTDDLAVTDSIPVVQVRYLLQQLNSSFGSCCLRLFSSELCANDSEQQAKALYIHISS